jgi:hypothetical protein
MELTEFTIRLVILLLPGILGTLIIDRLVIHKPWKEFIFLVNVIVVSIFSYLTLQLVNNFICFITCKKSELLNFWIYIEKSNITAIPYTEIIYASFISVFIAFISSANSKNGWINKIAQYLKITNKYGNESVYYRILNAKDVDWIYLRSPDTNLTYRGQVAKYSEDDKTREIVLYNVTVYRYSNSNELYFTAKVYLCFPIENKLIIEIPN